jgi:hypothetical protein
MYCRRPMMIDDAMAVAEENAVHQFGKYAKLT